MATETFKFNGKQVTCTNCGAHSKVMFVESAQEWRRQHQPYCRGHK